MLTATKSPGFSAAIAHITLVANHYGPYLVQFQEGTHPALDFASLRNVDATLASDLVDLTMDGGSSALYYVEGHDSRILGWVFVVMDEDAWRTREERIVKRVYAIV